MPDRRRFGRTPDTICLLAACAISGTALTVTGNAPPSIIDLASLPVALAWSAVFSLGAAFSLIGVLWRDHLTGWLLELSGRVAFGPTSLVYGAVLVGNSDSWGVALVASILTTIGIASFIRIYQLTHRLRDFKAVILAQRAATPEITTRRWPWRRP